MPGFRITFTNGDILDLRNCSHMRDETSYDYDERIDTGFVAFGTETEKKKQSEWQDTTGWLWWKKTTTQVHKYIERHFDWFIQIRKEEIKHIERL